MKNFGFVKVAAAVPTVKVADPAFNAQQILTQLKQAAKSGVRCVVFPQLSMTGYTCADLFLKSTLLNAAEEALADLLQKTKTLDVVFIVGIPVRADAVLLNAAAVCYKGQICGVVPKTYLPSGKDEGRWFVRGLAFSAEEITLCGQIVPVGTDLLFKAGPLCFGVEIGEDLWATLPPSSEAVLQGAHVIFNLSASNALVAKHAYVRQVVAQQSARGLCAYVYASCGFGESTTDGAFDANALIFEDGKELACSKRFALEPQLVCAEVDVQRLQNERMGNPAFRTDSALETSAPYGVIEINQPEIEIKKLTRRIDPLPFVPTGKELDEHCEEIFNIQVAGLATRLLAAHAKAAVIGISGGLDSTLALLATVRTFDKLKWPRKQIIGVTMPGFGTTGRTYKNALALMKQLGITVREISIKKACEQHFKDIGHNSKQHDATYENAQARERTQILMDMANQIGGLVVGTGDLSETALGWCTYNGDHMSMYGVNADVPKTLVKSLVLWVAAHETTDKKTQKVLVDVANTPISPELLPADKKGRIAQKTEDLVGPYVLHDFFLYYFVRYGFGPGKIFFLAKHAFAGQFKEPEIKKWLTVFVRRFFSQQFKRSCMPDGPKVGSVGLSPRGDLKMPSDASAAAWLNELQ